MTCYLVTESAADAAIVTAVLSSSSSAKTLKVIDGRDRSNAESLAMTLATQHPNHVGLIQNAGGTEALRVKSIRADLLGLLRSVASGDRVEAFVAVPELEVVFFHAPDALAEALGRPIPENVLSISPYAPKKALARLMDDPAAVSDPAELKALVRRIGPERLRGHPLMQEITGFLARAGREKPQVARA